MKKLIVNLFLTFTIAALCGAAYAEPVKVTASAGSIVVKQDAGYGYKALHLEWTSHASAGTVTATIDNFAGRIARVSFAPGGTTPSNAYDVVLTDLDGVDVLQGDGANLSSTVPADHIPTIVNGTDEALAVYTVGRLTLAITNAGNSKTGELTLVVEDGTSGSLPPKPVVNFSAGSVVKHIEEAAGCQIIHLDWTSHASAGTVTGTLDNIFGEIQRFSHAPVAAASPTASYDLVITDLCGVDVLETLGANLSNTTPADAIPTITEGTDNTLPVCVAGRLSFAITNAGNSKRGSTTLILKR